MGLVRLDTNAIRTKSLKDYRKVEKALDKLKLQLKRFREHDTPGFLTWMHKTFGSLLTRQRELAQAIHGRQELLREIMDIVDRYKLSDVEAYSKVQWRRAHPEQAQAEDIRFEEEILRRREAQRGRPVRECDAYDADSDPDDIFDNDAFKTMPDEDWNNFDDFYETMTGNRPPPNFARRSHQEDVSARDIYRTIVRQLHPDHHGAMSENRKNLWHEAQEAYRRRDVAALYNVLVRCDSGKAGLGQHTPISMIHRMTAQLRRAMQSTRAEIRRMKSDPAWNYESRAEDPRYANRLRSAIQYAIDHAGRELRDFDDILARLERNANRAQRQSQTKRKRSPQRDLMDDFLL